MAKRKRKPGERKKFDPLKSEQPKPSSPLDSFLDLPEPTQDRPLTPTEARWLEFQEADYEGQIALCHQTIEEEALMDAENAFEMFDTIYYATVERDERHRFEELAQKLRERLPEVFAHEAHYILDWQLSNALVEGRLADVTRLAAELATKAGEHIDQFTRTLERLDYHGQLATLLEIMPIAWPAVKNNAGILGWAIDEFAVRGADYIIFDELERGASLNADDPDLLDKLSFYLPEIEQDRLAKFLDYLTGRAERTWVMADFGFERAARKKKPEKTAKLSDEARQNLYDLTIELLGYLRREAGVPYTKGSLARKQIYSYLLERHAGDLEPTENIFEAMQRSPRRKPRQPKMRYPDHWLCPDRGSLDRFLAQLLGFLSGRYHEAVATFELIPAWLSFLESRQLIDSGQREKTLQELRGLDTELLKVVKDHSDPALARAIEHWRE